jgi:predicted metal-dependent phosphoesterase TrpH
MKLDLHIHSSASADGIMEISEIVKAAKERGIDGVAICDHDVFYS